MSIVVTCSCGKSYPIKEQFAGQRVQCPGCQRVLTVPGGAPPLPRQTTAPRPSAPPNPFAVPQAVPPQSEQRSPLLIVVILFLLILAAGGAAVFFLQDDKPTPPAASTQTDTKKKDEEPPLPVIEVKPVEPKPVKPVEPAPRDVVKVPRVEEKPKSIVPKPRTPPQPPPAVSSGSIWEGHKARILNVAFARDGKFAFTATGGLVKRGGQQVPALDSTIRIWDWTAGKEKQRIDGFTRGLWTVALDPAGNLFAAVDAADAGDEPSARPDAFDLRVWEIAGKREVRVLKGHDKIVLCAAFTPDGRKLVSGGRDATVRIWDVDTGKQYFRIDHPSIVYGVAVSDDGKFALSACGDRTVRLFDIAAKRLLKTFPRHQDLVRAVAFSPDGKFAVSAGGRDFDASTNAYIVGSNDYEIRLWDLSTGQEVRRFSGHTDMVTSLAFSRDGRRLLSGSWDKTVRLWHVPSGRMLGIFGDHTKLVESVAFFPDGHRSLSGGWDSTVRVWTLPLDVGDLAKKLLEPGADRLGLLREIARYGAEAKDTVPTLLKLLNDPTAAVKRAALETLTKVGTVDKSQVELLIPLLKDDNFAEGRKLALDSLAGVGPAAEPALPNLLALIKDKPSDVRVQALRIIGGIGENARSASLSPLLELLRDEDAAVAKAASEALPKLGKPAKSDLPTLIKSLTDTGEAERRYSLLAITELGTGAVSATSALVSVLEKDESAELRLLALQALVKVQEDGKVLLGPLTKALDDTSSKIQALAAERLTLLPDSAGLLAALLQALGHNNPKVQEIVDKSLAKFPFTKENLKLLTDNLKSKHAKVRLRMIHALMKLGADAAPAVPAMIELVKTAKGEERSLLVTALGAVGPDASDAGPVLLGLLKDADRRTQLSICLVLSKIKSDQAKEALPFLVGLLKINEDTEEADRKTAAETLIAIGQPAVDALMKAMTNDFTGVAKSRADARIAAIQVIVSISQKTKDPTRRALLPLATLERNDPDPRVRAVAKLAFVELQKQK